MQFSTKGEVAWASAETQFVLKTKEWRYRKPILDQKKCNNCGICSLFCPSGCIEEFDEHYVVDMEYCKGCGICARLCPKEAMEMKTE